MTDRYDSHPKSADTPENPDLPFGPFRLFDPEGDADRTDPGTDQRSPDKAAKAGDAIPPVTRETQRELDRIAGVSDARTVTITLGQMVPLVTDAAAKNRLWLSDFSDETVRIDADLYEVLLAYQRMRQRDAA